MPKLNVKPVTIEEAKALADAGVTLYWKRENHAWHRVHKSFLRYFRSQRFWEINDVSIGIKEA